MSHSEEFTVLQGTPGHLPPLVRPFQFTLRTLLSLTTVVAVVCSGLFAPAVWMVALTLLVLGMLGPMALTVALIYGRGYLRTFCIGALFPAAPILLLDLYYGMMVVAGLCDGGFHQFTADGDANSAETRMTMAVAVVVIVGIVVLAGLLAMGVRWVVQSGQRP
jgi:hypothetical protein